MRTAVLVVFAAFGLAFLQAAHGHASLLASSPEDGERLSEPLAEVELVFSEEVRLLALYLEIGEDGQHPLEALPAEALERFSVPVDVNVDADDPVTVVWRAISEDGHVVEGSFAFAIDPAS